MVSQPMAKVVDKWMEAKEVDKMMEPIQLIYKTHKSYHRRKMVEIGHKVQLSMVNQETKLQL
jgi:hypothetical protein